MTRGTILRGLTRALWQQVPKARRRHARILFAAIEDQWAAAMSAAEAQAYDRGVQAEQTRRQSGFQLGYQRGIEHVMAQTGSPARRVDDDDLMMGPS